MSDDTTPATHEVRLSGGESRRAFVLNVLNGGLYSFADSLMDANLVLVWFASQLTTSNLLLGLIAPINSGAWYLPQLFLSGRVQAMPRQIVLYRWMTVVRFSTWVLLAAALWWLRAPLLLLGAFYALYTITRLASGAAGIPYLEVTAKTIPPRQRGRMFALRQLTAGLLALIGTRVIRRVLVWPAALSAQLRAAGFSGGVGRWGGADGVCDHARAAGGHAGGGLTAGAGATGGANLSHG